VFEVVLRGRARASRAELSEDERADVDALFARLEVDPWLDGRSQFELPVPPLILWLFTNGVWRFVYRVVDNAFVEVYDIRRAIPR
jgi:hypothetical protein